MMNYFKNENMMYSFFLLELDGKSRTDKLGIKSIMFSNSKIASEWYNNILKSLENKDAIEKLNELYSQMAQ